MSIRRIVERLDMVRPQRRRRLKIALLTYLGIAPLLTLLHTGVRLDFIGLDLFAIRGTTMVTTLSDLIDMIERSTVPLWLRDQILAKSDVIDQAMRNGGSITLQGPDGEEIQIRAANHLAPAA
jgi:hypothetical protein